MKFCPNCGAELADDAVFCGACGTQLNQENVEQPAESDKSAILNKRFLIFAAAVIVAVVIVIVLVVTLLSGGGYKGQIKKYFNFFNSKNTNGFELNELTMVKPEYEVYKAMYDTLIEPCGDDAEDVASFLGSEFANNSEYYEDLYDDYEDDYGKNWKIKYEIKKEKEMKDDDLEDIQDYIQESGEELLDSIEDEDDFEDEMDEIVELLEDECDIKISKSDIKNLLKTVKASGKSLSKAKVKEGYNVTVKYTIEGKEDKGKGEATLRLIKVDGDWVVYNAGHVLSFK